MCELEGQNGEGDSGGPARYCTDLGTTGGGEEGLPNCSSPSPRLRSGDSGAAGQGGFKIPPV